MEKRCDICKTVILERPNKLIIKYYGIDMTGNIVEKSEMYTMCTECMWHIRKIVHGGKKNELLS